MKEDLKKNMEILQKKIKFKFINQIKTSVVCLVNRIDLVEE
jgi:uncharacterized FlaG/YvyC family protein